MQLCKLKTILGCYYIPARIIKTKTFILVKSKAGKYGRNLVSHISGINIKCYSHSRNSLAVSLKIKHILPLWSSNYTPGYSPQRDGNSCTHNYLFINAYDITDTHTHIHTYVDSNRWPETCRVDQAVLELRDPPAHASRVQGLKEWTTKSGISCISNRTNWTTKMSLKSSVVKQLTLTP